MDNIERENNEISILLDRGIEFEIEKRSLLKYFSKKKTRKFLLKQPYLGTLDYLSNEYLAMNFDEQKIQDDPMGEAKRITKRTAKHCARVVAIAVLNGEFKIKLFTRILSKYFLWRIRPDKMLQITLLINTMLNLGDFINSIRLMSASRTTAPKLIEKAESSPA